MTEDVKIKITVDKGGADNSAKTIKQELREAKEQASQLSREFGINSEQALAAQKKVALLKDEMEDLSRRVNALDPDKFAQFSTAAMGVVRGFQAAQGAAALFGADSKELEKTLIKLQAAMALADGLKGVLDARKAFSGLAVMIKNNVVNAFKTLRGAIISTGIGALVVGVGMLVANFERVKDVIQKTFPGIVAFAKEVGKIVQAVTDWLGITSEANRSMEAQEKITNRVIALNKQKIELLEAEGGKEEEVRQLRIDSYTAELEMIRNRVDANKKATEEERKRIDELSLAIRVEIVKRRRAISEAQKAEQEKARKHSEELRKIREQEFKEMVASLMKLRVDIAARQRAALTEALRDMMLPAHLRKASEELKNSLLEFDAMLLQTANDRLAASDDFYKKLSQQRREQLDKEIEERKVHNQTIMAMSVGAAMDTLSALRELNNSMDAQTEEQQKKQFKRNQQLAIVETLINTYTAAMKAFATAPNPYLGVAFAALATTAGLIRVAAIKKQKFKGASDTQGAADAASSGTAATAGTVSNTNAMARFKVQGAAVTNSPNTQSSFKVYVLDKDIKSVGDKNDRILRKAVVK